MTAQSHPARLARHALDQRRPADSFTPYPPNSPLKLKLKIENPQDSEAVVTKLLLQLDHGAPHGLVALDLSILAVFNVGN
jgi:hypothetical protein